MRISALAVSESVNVRLTSITPRNSSLDFTSRPAEVCSLLPKSYMPSMSILVCPMFPFRPPPVP